jgi:hypothetical protein
MSPAGTCDAQDVCSGTSANCVDKKQPSTFLCRTIAGDCDLPEFCTGTTNDCPVDAFRDATYVCRAACGLCDDKEICTGSSAACPANGFLTPGTSCDPGLGSSCGTGTCNFDGRCDLSSLSCGVDLCPFVGAPCGTTGFCFCNTALKCACPGNACTFDGGAPDGGGPSFGDSGIITDGGVAPPPPG